MRTARWYQRDENRSMLSLILAFLGCGLLHVFLYGVPFTTEIVRIVCGVMALLWAHSIRERIIDGRVRRLLIGVSCVFALLFLLQFCQYHVLPDVTFLNRQFDYAYYVPITLIPMLVFQIALYLNVQETEKISPAWRWLWLPCGILIALFLTNDLHQWVFAFPDEITEMTRTANGRYMPVYWCFAAWSAVLLLSTLITFIRKCRLPRSSFRLMLPLLPVVIGAVIWGLSPRFMGFKIWNLGEVYAFMGFGFLESCISIGFIPSNRHYRRVFSLLDIPARIEDTAGNVLYRTVNAPADPAPSDDLQLHTASIRGGSVSWLVDLTQLHRLDRELEHTVEQLESRNSLLQEETAVREEKEQHETRSRLYAHIARTVAPQLNAVERLLAEHPDAGPDTLAHIAVLNAYIKRRGNLELMAEDAQYINSRELMLAIHESFVYAELCGVETYADCTKEYSVPSKLIIEAYAGFEQLLERTLDHLLAVAVYVFADREEVRLRFNCQVKNGDAASSALLSLPCLMECQRDVNDLTITLGFSAGGDAAC
ncbi:MAG: hypothetical protein MJ136_06305 [Clostridia bacterium]|nr:hypothetical protein [Clostridia bacterium]